MIEFKPAGLRDRASTASIGGGDGGGVGIAGGMAGSGGRGASQTSHFPHLIEFISVQALHSQVVISSHVNPGKTKCLGLRSKIVCVVNAGWYLCSP